MKSVRVMAGGSSVLALDAPVSLSEDRAVAARLALDPSVEYAEQNIMLKKAAVPMNLGSPKGSGICFRRRQPTTAKYWSTGRTTKSATDRWSEPSCSVGCHDGSPKCGRCGPRQPGSSPSGSEQ